MIVLCEAKYSNDLREPENSYLVNFLISQVNIKRMFVTKLSYDFRLKVKTTEPLCAKNKNQNKT